MGKNSQSNTLKSIGKVSQKKESYFYYNNIVIINSKAETKSGIGCLTCTYWCDDQWSSAVITIPHYQVTLLCLTKPGQTDMLDKKKKKNQYKGGLLVTPVFLNIWHLFTPKKKSIPAKEDV